MGNQSLHFGLLASPDFWLGPFTISISRNLAIPLAKPSLKFFTLSLSWAKRNNVAVIFLQNFFPRYPFPPILLSKFNLTLIPLGLLFLLKKKTTSSLREPIVFFQRLGFGILHLYTYICINFSLPRLSPLKIVLYLILNELLPFLTLHHKYSIPDFICQAFFHFIFEFAIKWLKIKAY
ncbi:MAG: hypothetical protein WC657_00670 [Candidatus Paceibacterota bacterium]|jgi:hypothetical protein